MIGRVSLLYNKLEHNKGSMEQEEDDFENKRRVLKKNIDEWKESLVWSMMRE